MAPPRPTTLQRLAPLVALLVALAPAASAQDLPDVELPGQLVADEAPEPAPDPHADLGAEQIVERWLQTQAVRSELAFVKMTRTVPGDEPRETRFLVVYQTDDDGRTSYMLRIVRPRDVEGTSIVARERAGEDAGFDQWLFLPELGVTRRLDGVSTRGAFLGSDFSYDDLLAEVPEVHRYERLDDEVVQGRPCFVVRAVEKQDGDPAYGWRELALDKQTNQLHRCVYYDTEGRKLKTLTTYDYGSPEIVGSTTRPRRAVMLSTQGDTWTDFTVVEGRLDETFDPAIFTAEKMESWTDWEVEEFIFGFGIEVR